MREVTGYRFDSLIIQGGSNMTGTNCDLFTHKSSRSYLNHLVHRSFHSGGGGRRRRREAIIKLTNLNLVPLDDSRVQCVALLSGVEPDRRIH
jgi:hypothetical protein